MRGYLRRELRLALRPDVKVFRTLVRQIRYRPDQRRNQRRRGIDVARDPVEGGFGLQNGALIAHEPGQTDDRSDSIEYAALGILQRRVLRLWANDVVAADSEPQLLQLGVLAGRDHPPVERTDGRSADDFVRRQRLAVAHALLRDEGSDNAGLVGSARAAAAEDERALKGSYRSFHFR